MADTIFSSAQQIQTNRTTYAEYFAEKQDANAVSMDTFLNLLMAEMSNQDPLEPMSNTEFVSQMAQFTSLQAMQDMANYTNAGYASSLVGKTVTVTDNTASNNADRIVTGVVSGVQISGTDYKIVVNGKPYSMKYIGQIGTGSTGGTGNAGNTGSISSDLGYASSLIGKYATVEFDNNGSMVYAEGRVDSIEVQNNEVMVVIEDLAFPLSSVVRVANKAIDLQEGDTDDSTKALSEL